MKNPINIIMICIGFNNYEKIYGQCIESHRKYASKFGYKYVLITTRASTPITTSVWLKIPLIIRALEKKYDWVVTIDADCQISQIAPKLETLEVEDKSLYMAKGFSGRINSGVVIIKNTEAVKSLFKTIYTHSSNDVPEADWGENGHVIHFASQWHGLQLIDRKWNNNADPTLQDYIRHFSAGGPMRSLYPATYTERIIGLVQYIKNRLNRKKYLPRNHVLTSVETLFHQVIKENYF